MAKIRLLFLAMSISVLVTSACSAAGGKGGDSTQPQVTPTPWPTTISSLKRCSTLDLPAEQQALFDPETRWRYVASDGQTRVIDRQTDEVVATIPVAGEVSFNRCNNRVLIAAGEQGISIVDGATQRIIAHIPYLLEGNLPASTGEDTNTYAIGALSNTVTNNYFILIRRLLCAHGGCWQVTDLNLFDDTTLAINPSNSYGGFDPTNAVYDPVAGLFYTTTYCCRDVPFKTVSAWDANWTEEVRVLYGIGGGQSRYDPSEYVADAGSIRLDAAKRRLYVKHMRWELALDADTFRIVGTYPEGPQAMPSVTENILPGGFFISVYLSPDYVQDRTLFLLTSTGLYRSTDGGQHWSSILLYSFSAVFLTGEYTVSLSPDYGNDQTLFLRLASADPNTGEGLLKSTDAGDTWRPINTGLPGLNIGSLLLSSDYSGDHTLWASVVDGSTNAFVPDVWMISTNAGDSWEPEDSTRAIPTTPSPDSSLTICNKTVTLGEIGQAVQATQQNGTPVWFVVRRGLEGGSVYSDSGADCWYEIPIPMIGRSVYT